MGFIYKNQEKMMFSEATVENICSKAAEILESHYQLLKRELQESKATNNDETSKRIEGENCWEWVFVKPDTVVFHSDERRSHDVIEELYVYEVIDLLYLW